jgi:hypothetical protein
MPSSLAFTAILVAFVAAAAGDPTAALAMAGIGFGIELAVSLAAALVSDDDGDRP